MERSPVIVEANVPFASTNAAVLTLTRGASGWNTWTFMRQDAGTRITVGSQRSCDWQVTAIGVPPVILFFTGDTLWAGIERANKHVLRNDATLPRGWTQLRHGDRMELGIARIGVALAPDLRAEPSKLLSPHAGTLSELEHHLVATPTAAILRLIRGKSERAAWTFRASDMGIGVTIGAAKSCDWPIVTGGPERCELALLFAGGTLLAKRKHKSRRVRVDGLPLGEEWAFVQQGSRIEIGLACLELQLGPETTGLPPLPPGVPRDSRSYPPIPIVLHSRADVLVPMVPPPPPPVGLPRLGPASPQRKTGMQTISAQKKARKLPPPPPPRPAVLVSGEFARPVPPPNLAEADHAHPRRQTAATAARLKLNHTKTAWRHLKKTFAGRRTTELERYALWVFFLSVLYAGWVWLLDAM